MRIAPYVNRRIRKFDLVLETTPENFGNWLNSELRNTFPKGLQWSEKINNLSLGGILYDPVPEENIQNYQYCVDGVVFDDRYQFQQKIPLLFFIEMRNLNQEKIEVICECFDHPPLIFYIDSLINRIHKVFEVHEAEMQSTQPSSDEKKEIANIEIDERHKSIDDRTVDSWGGLLRLVEFRRKVKEEKGIIPPWGFACKSAKIDPKTANKWIKKIDINFKLKWNVIKYDGITFAEEIISRYPLLQIYWDEREKQEFWE